MAYVGFHESDICASILTDRQQLHCILCMPDQSLEKFLEFKVPPYNANSSNAYVYECNKIHATTYFNCVIEKICPV